MAEDTIAIYFIGVIVFFLGSFAPVWDGPNDPENSEASRLYPFLAVIWPIAIVWLLLYAFRQILRRP